MKKKYITIEKKQARWGFFFVVPSLLFFSVFSFYPILNAFYTSFFDKRALSKAAPAFLGLGNYKRLFNPATMDNALSFYNSLRSTFVFTIGTFVPLLIISLLLAVFISNLSGNRTKKFLQIAYYCPAVLSSVVAAAIWMIIFDPRGLGNQWLNALLGTPGIDRRWLVDGTMEQVSTMVIYFWKYIGYFVILFITGLASIPPTLYEASTIDGATKWQSFWKITLPLLKPTVVLVSIMAMLQCLKTFSTQYMLYSNGAPRAPINVITFNIYVTGIQEQYLGRASAMSVVLFLLMLFFTWAQFRVSKSDQVDY
ncbi:carbohydrate ABC transporter permease [Parasphaerochaeta coccoides]|uniref:Carbohydrate ABC transporter membrane protein 1, CUT1 family n=1 Tax=Parasphaerochaeta coccoides (strain ATCC BAA-1237 / DSM 17374 / SPN1) TaxID=760011 RepID=F4GJY7_PARC1|nr:sugar ABC transporter permease [Parasphaerochaeta coccoides]AEC01412.1 carbohydrate ABC transporter membrane protein 1, CUT1 family [Parasphaerochaeta coccoides DSM 17374]